MSKYGKKRFRFLNKIYANIAGYFWLPCPICGEYFGGHEWKDDCELMINSHSGKGVCQECCEEAKRLNGN